MKKGPVLLIDDDIDDQEIFASALNDLGIPNPLLTFFRSADAYAYLIQSTEQPFVIFCDINLPDESGIAFKQRLDENAFLRQKSIPFIFFSTSTRRSEVVTAYTQMTIQGYFQKPSGYKHLSSLLDIIFQYWDHCIHPNN